jgi:hypothetical protein
MSEIQKEYTEQTIPSQQIEGQTNLFADIEDMQLQAERSASRRLVDEDHSEEHIDQTIVGNPNKSRAALKAVGITTALAAGIGIGATIVNDAHRPPTFSEETTSYQVQPGDGMYSVVESIPGAGSVDQRDIIDYVSADPANIDLLKDGLQAGESISVPVSINGVELNDDTN